MERAVEKLSVELKFDKLQKSVSRSCTAPHKKVDTYKGKYADEYDCKDSETLDHALILDA